MISISPSQLSLGISIRMLLLIGLCDISFIGDIAGFSVWRYFNFSDDIYNFL